MYPSIYQNGRGCKRLLRGLFSGGEEAPGTGEGKARISRGSPGISKPPAKTGGSPADTGGAPLRPLDGRRAACAASPVPRRPHSPPPAVIISAAWGSCFLSENVL